MVSGIRDLYKTTLVPPWLADDAPPNASDPVGGVGGRLCYTMGLTRDAIATKLHQAMLAHMPGQGTPTALPYLGFDRQIIRGLNESDGSYAGRLSRAYESWQHAGQAPTVLREVLDYLGASCKTMLVYPSTLTAVAFPDNADRTLPPALETLTSWTWGTGYGVAGAPGQDNGDDPHPLAAPFAWWRVWLVLYSVGATAWCTDEGAWGDDANWGDDTASWGLSVPWTVIASIRAIIGQWKSATWYRYILVSFSGDFAHYADGAAFYPPATNQWSDGYVIGTAANENGTTVPAYVNTRDDRIRYCDGIGTTGTSAFPYY